MARRRVESSARQATWQRHHPSGSWAGWRFEGLSPGLSPGGGREVCEGAVAVGGQALEEVAQVGEGVEIVEAGKGDQAVEDRGAAAALVATGDLKALFWEEPRR